MPRKKLSSKKRAAATAKALLTRCKNKCEKTGGRKQVKSASKKRKMNAAQRAGLEGWRAFMAVFWADYQRNVPNGTYRDAQKQASAAWREAHPK